MRKPIANVAKLIVVGLTTIILVGCATYKYVPPVSNFKRFYTHKSPSVYPPNTNTLLHFHYGGSTAAEISKLFDDYLLIGSSGFTIENSTSEARTALAHARSVGADIIVTTGKFLNKTTKQVPTTVQTRSSGGFFAGESLGSWTPVTSYGTTTVMKNVAVDKYLYWGLYYKNVNKVQSLWDLTESDYPRSETNRIEGIWKNQDYRLKVYQSGKKIVAFLIDTKNDVWKQGDLKIICGASLGNGVYLMGSKAPMPVNIRTNKFGHIEIEELIGSRDVFSFEKEK